MIYFWNCQHCRITEPSSSYTPRLRVKLLNFFIINPCWTFSPFASAPHSSSESLGLSMESQMYAAALCTGDILMELWVRRGVCNRMQQCLKHSSFPFHPIKNILCEQIRHSHGAQQKHFPHCTHWSKNSLWKWSGFQGESKPTATAQEKKYICSIF